MGFVPLHMSFIKIDLTFEGQISSGPCSSSVIIGLRLALQGKGRTHCCSVSQLCEMAGLRRRSHGNNKALRVCANFCNSLK